MQTIWVVSMFSGVYLVDKIATAYFMGAIQKWRDVAYRDLKIKPPLYLLRDSYEIPQHYFRRIAWWSFAVIITLGAIGISARYFIAWPSHWVVQIVICALLSFRTIRFFDSYRYVNEFARLQYEKNIQDQSTSSH